MNTALAIYDALLQAGVSEAPARRVVEALEQDMNTLLATKQDILVVKQDILLVRQEFAGLRQEFAGLRQEFAALREEFHHFEQLMLARMSALEDRVALQFQNFELRMQALESRIVIRLSVVMTGLIALATTIISVLR